MKKKEKFFKKINIYFREQHDEALSKMKVLRICKIEGETLIINSGFRKNLKNAMNGGLFFFFFLPIIN